MRIGEALAQAQAQGITRLDAQLLLAHRLQRPRTWLLAHDDEQLDTVLQLAFATDLGRRAAGVPVAYLVGEREFFGLMLQVSPAVLVPRPETELLVHWALERLRQAPATTVIDLGTGSGAVALAVARHAPQAKVTATDASSEALAVARANAGRLKLAVDFSQGDWWESVLGRRFGVAVSNPPYVAGDDPHLAALVHEPRQALTPEGDGLAALRRVINDAPAHLLPGAWLLVEHGHDQAAAVGALFARRGFGPAQLRHDLAGLPRCSGAVWPASHNE